MSFDFASPAEADEDSIFESNESRPAPPPLRIYHFMLCAAVAACQLTLWHNSIPATMLRQIPIVAVALNAMYEGLAAIGFTLAVLSIYWHAKGYAGLVQPGQWFLLRYLISTVLRYAIMLLGKVGFDWSDAQSGFDGTAVWFLVHACYSVIFTIIPCMFFTYCAWAVADTRPWRWVFAAFAVISVFKTSEISHILSAYLNVPVTLAIATATLVVAGVKLALESWTAASDFASQHERYWPHWAGIGVAIIDHAFVILGAVLALIGWL
jgi:hypothetical protein